MPSPVVDSMSGRLTIVYPGRRRCPVTAGVGLIWALLFVVSSRSSGYRHQDHRLRRLSGRHKHTASTGAAAAAAAAAAFQVAHLPHVLVRSRRAATTKLDATLAPVEEKVEEKRARLPSWELLPLHGMFDQLEEELTRQPFTDETWSKSSDILRMLAVSLAKCVLPFEEHPYLPMQHAAALLLVGRLSERCKRAGKGEQEGVPTDLFSCLKYSTKKNGVARAAADVADGVCPKYDTNHGQQLVVTGVERCLAECSLVWSAARLLEASAPPETKRDFVFHLKALLEHAPARDRHQSVLILCRGLFTPGHNDAASRVYDNVHGAALRLEEGGYSLAGSFEEVQRGVKDNPGGLRAARQAFPFLEILARWAWRCETPEVAKKMSSTKSFGKKKFGKKKNAKGTRKGSKLEQGEEEPDVTVLPVAHTTAAVGTVGGVAELGVEGSQPSTPPVVDCGTGRNVAEGGGEGLKPAGGGFVGGARGRQDTGVAALLVALATADPSGDAIRSMQRWACEALLPEEIAEAASNELVDKNEVARGIICTHGIFVQSQKSNRQRWMKACREVGQVLRLLVRAMDEEQLEGEEVTRLVNHAMFGTTFLRSMPHGVAARKGYEHLVAGGRVPGDTKGVAVSQVSSRVNNWREAAKALDSGIAAVLKVPEETVRSDAFRNALSVVLKTWQSPYALADYYVMQRKEREVFKVYLRFLRALLGVSGETVRDIRIKDVSNREHMRHFPSNVRQLWEAEPSTLRGTTDPEVIFRMGEDTRSCMGIRRSCSTQNRALLGYLLQGNVRLVGVQSASGRMEARAVLRLLLRSDSMAPTLFMDSIYYSTNPDTSLEQQVVAEAQSVSGALGVPLYRAGDKIVPDPQLTDLSEDVDDDQWDDHGSINSSGSGMSVNVAAEKMCELIEVDGLSAWIYSDGAVGDAYNPGLMYRDSYPGSPRKIVLAELAYAQTWNDFDDF